MRPMTSAAVSAATSEHVTRAVAMLLDIPGGAVRVASTPFPLTIGGEEFLGVGALGSVSTIDEGADLQSYLMSVALSGIPRDAVAAAMAAPWYNKPATIWEVLLTEAHAVIGDPVVVFRGRMTSMQVELGQTASVQVTLQNRLIDWSRPRISRYSSEEQRRLHPGDHGLDFAAGLAGREIVWPTRQYYIDEALK